MYESVFFAHQGILSVLYTPLLFFLAAQNKLMFHVSYKAMDSPCVRAVTLVKRMLLLARNFLWVLVLTEIAKQS